MHPRRFDRPDGSALSIRPLAVEDAPAVVAYLDEVCGESDYLSFGPGEREITVEQAAERIREHDTPLSLYLAALVGTELVGMLSFEAGKRPRTKHSGTLGMTVRRKHWGEGIGSRLMDALIDWAQGTGTITKLNLEVRTDNRRAIALYRKKGFEVEGTIRRDFRIGDRYFDHHWMGRIV